MKVSLALFATVLVASVGMISSGGVPPELTDASILQDVRRHAELLPRVGTTLETEKIRFEIRAKIVVSRGFIPTYTDERQLAIPRGSRCMQFDRLRLSLILTPDYALIAVPNAISGRIACEIPEENIRLFRAINIAVADAMYQGILRSIPSGLPAYI